MPQPHDVLARLVARNSPYWAGEYALVHRYFTGGMRTRERDLGWITLQMYKEWTGSGVYGERGVTVNSLIKRAAEKIDHIDAGRAIGDLDAISDLLQFALDEFNHFAILCKAYLGLGPQARQSIEQMGDIPEGRRLVEMRHAWRQRPNGGLVVELTEGGGLGMYFAIGDVFEARPPCDAIDELIARFAQATVHDETEHMAGRFRRALAGGLSDAEWAQADAGLQELFAQKLRERNQQFGGVFSDAELVRMGTDRAAGQTYTRNKLGFLSNCLGAAA